ncbi:MAG TPA: PSD1 and planctomycete cytochrome C domain-containing protein [Bryobacteraceae bacterium]|nr:PSD1 and planctomycete cytochrome C domain-containing protein [Bryobacteraceae bacterium]
MSKKIFIFMSAMSAVGLWSQTAEQVEFFEKNVRPVLAAKCQMCHNAKAKTSGLDMSTGQGFFAGGASGSLVNVESPEESLLLKALSYEGSLKMPPMGKLKDDDIGKLREWIKMGAPWPGVDKKAGTAVKNASGTRKHGSAFTDEEWKFWAFQPVKKPAVPAADAAWGESPIDAFLIQKMREKGVKPAQKADKYTLLRRATYDLHGLPPTEQEIRDFVNDKSPDAFRKVVDRLLASPRYGEKWGRNWLDVARFADSTGNDEDHRYPYAYKYRDYVIESFNEDTPYNQFVKEQIAGDLMPGPKPGDINRRGVIATGFLALGAKAIAQQDKKKMLYDVWDEQVDTTSKAFLGVTLACARCHDHKFDPLTQKDYYGMVGMFASTKSFANADSHVSKLLFTPLVSKSVFETYEKAQHLVANKGVDIDIVMDRERQKAQERLLAQLPAYMLAAKAVRAGKTPDMTGLDKTIVDKWVKHYNESEVPRAWLDPFHAADEAGARAIAVKFQESAAVNLAAWAKKMARYRIQARRQIEEQNMLSEMPKHINEKDGFFRDVFADAGPFGVSAKAVDKVATPEGKTELAALRAEQKKLKDALPPEPEMACAVQDDKPVLQKVLVRGDYNSLGEDAPKTFPLVIAGEGRRMVQQGSGRMELAEWLASDTNPMTARVMVNRIWQGHFGEGIVRTPDNFGRMGERPTHPELLDYLAAEFVEKGWSMKAMHRLMMNSSAYQMSSAATPEQMKTDGEDKLFSRFPRRRLLVEEMRDGMLALSGKMDWTMGGTMQSGFGTDGENSNGRLSISPEDQVRRTVYMPLRRANLPALLNLFDFGDATTPNGRRVVTNVAPQALFLMNSKFVAEQADALAKAVLTDGALDPKQKVEHVYLRVLNRPPSAAEVDNALSYAASFRQKFPKTHESDAWQSVARVLLASNEFIYVD